MIGAMLALWWAVLRDPMSWALREAAALPLGLVSGVDNEDPITLDSAGDWVFRMAVDGAAPPQGATAALRVNSIEFTIPRSEISLFTLSIPLLWAFLLALPATKRTIRPMLLGTAIVGCAEVLSLTVFVELAGHSFVAQGHPPASGVAAWLREVTNYLVMNVAPDIVPVLVALAVYPDLRNRIFSSESGASSESAPVPMRVAAPGRRAARRGSPSSRGR